MLVTLVLIQGGVTMSSSQVPVGALSVLYSHDSFQFHSTAELEELTDSLGQQRSLESLRFATAIENPGYNVYVIGETGLGKHEIVQKFLEKSAAHLSTPCDWVYVNNFTNADQPIAISLPAGEAKILQQQVHQFIEDLRTSIPSIYESERFRNRRDNLIKEFKEQQDKALSDLQERARREQVFLLNVRGGLVFAQGDKSGNLLDDEAMSKLTEQEQKEITERLVKYNDELVDVINQFPILERQLRSRLKEFSREMIDVAVETLSKELREKYSTDAKVTDYLEKMTKDILENSRYFRRSQEDHLDLFERGASPLKRYQVNLFVEQSKGKGCPVIYEDNPTFMNLVGQIEHISQLGALMTDFSLIKAGALHRANGGYLVLDAHKLLSAPYAWEGLKRSLKAQSINIESLGQVFSLISTVFLKPEPIPLNCKVILIGNREIYQLLNSYDPEFFSLFKVAADFDNVMVRTPKNEELFAQFVGSELRKKHLLPMNAEGVARLLSQAIRMAGDNERVSINLEKIGNLLQESHFFAQEGGRGIIGKQDVQNAIDSQFRRLSLAYEKVIDETTRGTLLVDVYGWATGQVNGLSVFEFGNFLFGRAARITATVRMGEGHVVDIEREIKLGGAVHSKGVLILSGFLKSYYAVDVPLSISASIVFEQSYGPVEGDSASLAELCALLSAISQLPIKQSLAVTGSINQQGEAQPVGAINEKIEGFYDLCQRKGATGEQGVVIPRANVKHLVLRDDVVRAVENNLFRIYAVDTVHDCIQLLTGLPTRTIIEKIEERLRLFSVQLQKVGRSERGEAPTQLGSHHIAMKVEKGN